MRKWETFKLGEVVKLKYGKPLIEENRVTGNYPTYSSAGIIGFNNIFFVQNCIIIGRKGNAGSVFLCNQPCFVIDTAFYIDEINENHSLIFLYYLLKTLNLNHFAADAAVPGLNREVAESLNISLPPLAEQERIARILGNYDALIANYEAQIHALQASAQQVYKEWFVRGRCPYGEMETEKPLRDSCLVITRGITPDYEDDTNLFCINQKANKGEFIDKSELKTLNTNQNINNVNFAKKGDLLLNSLGEGTLGRVHFYFSKDDVFVVDQHITILRPLTIEIGIYLYFYIASEYGNAKLQSLKAGGTNMTTLNINEVRKFETPVPSPAALTAFHSLVSPLFLQIENLQHQISVLKTTRDALLPRLLRA